MKLSMKLMSRRQRLGATSIEVAVVAPVFFLLIFGLIEFARMTMVQQALAGAARVGCRTAALATTTDSSDADAAVRNHLQSAIRDAGNASICRVSVSPNNLNGLTTGTTITTAVEVDYTDVSWIPPRFLSGQVIRREATMIRE